MRKLTVSGFAHAKIQAFRALTETETTGYGVFDEDFNVVDFVMLKHEATVASVDIEGEDEAHFTMQRISEGAREHITALWWHTHPGGSSPSSTDIKTFEEQQNQKPVSIMLIYGSDGSYYAEIAVTHKEFSATEKLQVIVDHTLPWGEETLQDWKAQVAKLCVKRNIVTPSKYPSYAAYPASKATKHTTPPAMQDWIENCELQEDTEYGPTLEEYKVLTEYREKNLDTREGLRAAWDEWDHDLAPFPSDDIIIEEDWHDGYECGRAILEGFDNDTP